MTLVCITFYVVKGSIPLHRHSFNGDSMDKNNLSIVLNEHLINEENCAFLHLSNNSELLIFEKPHFFNLMVEVEVKHEYGSDCVIEKCYIPYNSILYVTLTNINNLNIVSNYYQMLNESMK